MRVFVANIIAGGIGLNLTAARQVVFNDLDWVPANHWQAEDRAYRIGQTRTVNVTYLVGTGTVDEFVQAVLETKGALVNAVVEGKALAADLSGSVLDELERALRAISPGLADTPASIVDADAIERLLREASDELRAHESRSEKGAAIATPRGHRRAEARTGGARARALRAVSEPLPHREHVAVRRRLSHHGGRRRCDVQLPGLRVPGPMPPCARCEGRARGGIDGSCCLRSRRHLVFPVVLIARRLPYPVRVRLLPVPL